MEQIWYFFHFHSETCSRAFEVIDSPKKWSTQRLSRSFVPVGQSICDILVPAYCLVMWPLLADWNTEINKVFSSHIMLHVLCISALPIHFRVSKYISSYLEDICTLLPMVYRIRIWSRTLNQSTHMICFERTKKNKNAKYDSLHSHCEFDSFQNFDKKAQ